MQVFGMYPAYRLHCASCKAFLAWRYDDEYGGVVVYCEQCLPPDAQKEEKESDTYERNTRDA